MFWKSWNPAWDMFSFSVEKEQTKASMKKVKPLCTEALFQTRIIFPVHCSSLHSYVLKSPERFKKDCQMYITLQIQKCRRDLKK